MIWSAVALVLLLIARYYVGAPNHQPLIQLPAWVHQADLSHAIIFAIAFCAVLLTMLTGNPVYDRPVVLVLYREDHRFLLDPIIPKPGGTHADYDLVIASQPYRARASLDFKAKRVIGPLARALGSGGRLIAIREK